MHFFIRARWILFIIFIFFISKEAYVQDMALLNKDSLINLLKNIQEDSNRVLLYIRIGNDFERNQPDSAIYYYRAAGELSRRINYYEGIIKYIANYTAVLNIENKLDESLEYNKQAVELSEKIHNDYYLGMSYGNMAAVYSLMHLYKFSIQYYLKCTEVYEKIHDNNKLSIAYSNLASIYSDIEQNEKAIWYGFKSISISKSRGDQYTLEMALDNTANAYAAIKNYDTALVLYSQAKELSLKLNDQYVNAECLLGIAEVLEVKKMFDEMKVMAIQAYKASRAIDHKEGMAKSFLLLARYYFHRKKDLIAENMAEKALSMSLENNMIETEQKAYALLSDIDLALGNMTSFQYYRNLSDSTSKLMVSKQIIQNTQELEAVYSLSKKEATINDLTKMQQLQQQSIRQGRALSIVLIVLLVILVLTTILFYRNHTQKGKLMAATNLVNEQRISELEKEKQLVAVKNLLQGQEQERERLARDLHDGLGSILSGVKYSLSKLKEEEFYIKPAGALLDKSLATLDLSIVELRRIAHNLMPESIMKLGLVDALTDFCELLNLNSGPEIKLQTYHVKSDQIPLETSSVIFRMIQELVQNTIRHANAKNLLVQLICKDHSLSITVEDDGAGFIKDGPGITNGIGFLNIRNRVISLNGNMEIDTGPGKGTSVHIDLPNIFL